MKAKGIFVLAGCVLLSCSTHESHEIGSEGDGGGTMVTDAGGAKRDSGADASSSGRTMDASADAGDAAHLVDAGPPEPICDGSSGVRLLMTNGGGFVQSSYTFTHPLDTFFILDGKCRYYAGPSTAGTIYTGTLSEAEALQLSAAIGYASIEAWSHTPSQNPCDDGGTLYLRRPGASASCYCGCDPNDDPSRIAAFSSAGSWIDTWKTKGTAISASDLTAAAIALKSVVSGAKAWPLSRAMKTIPGLIQTNDPIATPVRFSDAGEIAALRALRLGASENADTLPVEDGNLQYALYLRDELPANVASDVHALTGR